MTLTPPTLKLPSVNLVQRHVPTTISRNLKYGRKNVRFLLYRLSYAKSCPTFSTEKMVGLSPPSSTKRLTVLPTTRVFISTFSPKTLSLFLAYVFHCALSVLFLAHGIANRVASKERISTKIVSSNQIK